MPFSHRSGLLSLTDAIHDLNHSQIAPVWPCSSVDRAFFFGKSNSEVVGSHLYQELTIVSFPHISFTRVYAQWGLWIISITPIYTTVLKPFVPFCVTLLCGTTFVCRLITRFLLSHCRLHELWRRQRLNDHNVTELFVKVTTNSSLLQTLVTPCSAICDGEQQGENVMVNEDHFLAHFIDLSHKTANQHLYTKMLKAAQRELLVLNWT